MKKQLVFGSIVLLAGSLLAADATPKDNLTAAAQKLADSGGYAWKQTVDLGPNAPFTPGPTEGKTAEGVVWLSSSFNDNTTEGAKQGGKVVVKTDEGWKTAEEAGGGDGGGFNPNVFMARRLQNIEPPAVEVTNLAAKTTALAKDGDAYRGELTEDGAKSLLTMGFGRRGGPPATEAKGSLKVWITDGALTKYEFKVSGKREFNGETRDMERTTTVEIKDVGKTKITLPDEAKKKLNG